MQDFGATTTQTMEHHLREEARQVPGVVLVFANKRPRCRVFRWEGAPLELGRLELAEDDALDSAISRQHLRLRFDGTSWHAEDLGSRNGTFLEGRPLSGARALRPHVPVRVGGALLLPVPDTLVYQRYGLGARDGVVSGPGLQRALETIALSRKGDFLSSLLISGESGAGKEIAAKVFHGAGASAEGPFVAVNCATIPKDLAERLLFGSRRGAFSGATDAEGHVQAADGGTLFLDEVAELPAEVQTKLLRMLETREVTRLGSTVSERVNVCVCAATWRDLRREVSGGRFREDLYFRIGQPEIRLPPLRERVEEVAWHIQDVLATPSSGQALEASAAFIEACALRAWPGNVRELRAEVRRCAAVAYASDARTLTSDVLGPTAGTRFGAEKPSGPAVVFPNDDVSAALEAEAGNVVGAARRLGIHRNKIRRWLHRHGVDPRRFKT